MTQPLGGYREWSVEVGRCNLCACSDVVVFSFDDNEGYSKETMCGPCLHAALRLVNLSILKRESGTK